MSQVRRRAALAAGLALVFALGLALRSLGFETVFPGNGEVLFAVGDGHYHARLAFFSFAAMSVLSHEKPERPKCPCAAVSR